MKRASGWWFLLLLIPILLGLSRLRVDVEVLNLLPADLHVVEGLRLYQTHFAGGQEIIVTVTGADEQLTREAARNIAQRLRQEPTVRQVYWEAPWREFAGGPGELLAHVWLNQEPQEFLQVLNRLERTNLAPAFVLARERLATSLSPAEIALAAYDPLGMTQLPGTESGSLPGMGEKDDLFSSADGKFRVLFVQAKGELKGYLECRAWLNTVRAEVEKALGENYAVNYFGVKIGYTGRPVFTAEAAAEMQFDMTASVIGTALIIACLFWLAHRRVKPMLWLLVLLGAVLTITLALGGLVFGSINVIAVGFAAILLGLAVDYAVVHYQEALEHPAMSIPQIRRAIAPSIAWAAITTVAAFLVLNLGGLPGLAQLGTLVAMGIVVSALVMIFAFLPPLFPHRWTPGAVEAPHESTTSPNLGWKNILSLAFVFAMAAVLVWRGAPVVDATADPLRSANSQAFATMGQVIQNLGRGEDPYWLVCRGSSPEAVAAKLREVERALKSLGENIEDYSLPTLVWPNPKNRATNLTLVSSRSGTRKEVIRAEALEQGFSDEAIVLVNSILEIWEAEAASKDTLRDSATIRFILDRAMAESRDGFLALGLVRPAKLGPDQMNRLQAGLNIPDVWLTGWGLLGKGIYAHVRHRMIWLVAPVVGLILLSLWLAFRRWQEVCLSIGVLGVSGLGLLGLMSLTGWSWNLLNLVALPLLLGTGVDYSIFTQLALRRHNGDLTATHRSVGRALLLCGGTAITGFGSLAFSNNRGMASLGTVCAAGIAFNMLISVYLLPSWWLWLTRPAGSAASGPSSFYSAGLWRAGMIVGRTLPRFTAEAAARIVMLFYWGIAGHRRRVVESNLLPLCNADRVEARGGARRLFMNFGVKMIDLWRYEAGSSIEGLLGEFTGWEDYVTAKSRGRGVLLVGAHLGNWEFGGPCLTQRGIPLMVLTMAEPSEILTGIRQANRARWNVQTSVVRNDPFAFLEPVKRLEEGGTVAILIDRPSPETSVRVKLFGRDIDVSSAAAELARASGCALLPVCIVRQGHTYGAHMLPEVTYNRAALRDRSARDGLTQALMDVLAPQIARNADQWYHFVPVWPKN